MTKYPVSFSSNIVQRALGKKFEDFIEKYESAKLIRFSVEPTDAQYEMAEYAKKNGVKAAVKKFKVADHRVRHSIQKVARHYWLNN